MFSPPLNPTFCYRTAKRFVMIWEDARAGQVLLLLGSRKVRAAAAIPKPCGAWEVEMEEKVSTSNPAHCLQKLCRAPGGIQSFTASAKLFF